MELHGHLSHHWRQLDRKWGEPVDLDCSGSETSPRLLIKERNQKTFSSEEYLQQIKRKNATPYGLRKKVKSDFVSTTSVDSGVDVDLAGDIVRPIRGVGQKPDGTPCPVKSVPKDKVLDAMKDLVKLLEISDENEDPSDSDTASRRKEFMDVFGKVKKLTARYVKKKYGKKVHFA